MINQHLMVPVKQQQYSALPPRRKNMCHIKSGLAATLFLGYVLISSHAMAGDTLSGDEVRALIVGNTAHGKAAGGKSMKNYFDPGGTLVRSVDGKVVEGSYSIKDDGSQCIKVDGTDNCAKIAKNGDGTYNRVNSAGKVVLTWEKIVSGKDIP